MRCIYVIFFVLLLSCKQDKKYHDVSQKEVMVAKTDAVYDIMEFQKELNIEFKNPETSPLPDKYRKDFEHLNFFPLDTTFIVRAKLVRTPEAVPFLMPTTTDRKSEEVVFGIAHFTLNSEQHQLEVYQNKELMQEEKYRDYLFLPFTDKTNGEETYMGGRYLDLSIPEGDSIILNFNKAYNPYCVYNKKYSCPIVPGINALDTKILAGVKDFKPEKE